MRRTLMIPGLRGGARRWLALAGVLGLAILATLVVAARADRCVASETSATGPLERSTVSMSWPEDFGTVPNMAEASDLVVRGTVHCVAERRPGAHGHFGATKFNVVIDEVYVNRSGNRDPGQVIVHQSGGVQGNVVVELAGFPLLQEGEEVILFLEQRRQGEHPEDYEITGGPYGMFTVADGLVSARSSVHLLSVPGPVPVEAFVADLR